MAKPPRPCAPRLAQVFTSLHAIVIMALLLQTLAVLPGHAQDTWCPPETANYTATSQFKRNLDLLLANLSDVPATAARGHFRNASVGGPEDVAYGLVQCRGDVLPTNCSACLNLSASEVVSRCQLRRVVAIRKDNCLLRFSDKPIFGIMENRVRITVSVVQNTTDPEVFDQLLMDLVTKVKSKATEKSSRFAVGYTKCTSYSELYGLAQCTRDLSQRSCDECLRDLLSKLPRGKVGGAVSAVSCFLRFQTYPFFSFSVIPPPRSPLPLQPSPGPPPESSSAAPPPAGGGGSSTGWSSRNEDAEFELPIRSAESMSFSFGTLRTATGKFCDANKLGQGGFGPVYKGVLPDGQRIAVKRLLRSSGQGLSELRNEVVLVAKLHHRNLVRLVGFCLEEAEKMVVYEYLPNTSLDKFLFGVAGKKKHAPKILVIVIIPAVSAVVVFLFATVNCLKRRRPKKEVVNAEDEELIRSAESMSFSFGTLRTATGNFCDENKLGQGGFGPVYKGVLPDGQRIAVKRLLRSSSQGLRELRNEVVLVAKLHHRNLVRLVGFCLEEAEKMVVYEYLPNTSLDKFLFDPNKRLQLDWERRYKLIEGIARGLVYLHEETRFRIIHRDLKASNILLDEHMNPKISDFGLAKIFGVDETHGNTNRIAGTYGYMAPEYAMHGHFSIKSDVFSFGVLVLEIVTGRRNRGFQETEDATDLLSYVWHHWNEGAALQLLDPSIVERSQEREVLRCIHIGLLCVQEDPSERPNMSEVCLMLINSVMLPTPSRPAFLRGHVTRNDGVLLRGNDSTSSQDMEQRGVQSANVVSISDPEGR